MRKASLACAMLFAVAFASPSLAGPLSVTDEVTVDYSDLNLARAEGAKTLLGRLEFAARHVCGYGATDTRSVREMMRYRACFEAAMDGAVAKVDSRLVAEVYGKPMLVADGGGAEDNDRKRGIVLFGR